MNTKKLSIIIATTLVASTAWIGGAFAVCSSAADTCLIPDEAPKEFTKGEVNGFSIHKLADGRVNVRFTSKTVASTRYRVQLCEVSGVDELKHEAGKDLRRTDPGNNCRLYRLDTHRGIDGFLMTPVSNKLTISVLKDGEAKGFSAYFKGARIGAGANAGEFYFRTQ